MLSFWRKLAAFGYINTGMYAKKESNITDNDHAYVVYCSSSDPGGQKYGYEPYVAIIYLKYG